MVQECFAEGRFGVERFPVIGLGFLTYRQAFAQFQFGFGGFFLGEQHRPPRRGLGVGGRSGVVFEEASPFASAAGEPVGDGELVAAGGGIGVVSLLDGLAQGQGALVLLDGLRGVTQIQVGQSQHLADRGFGQRRSANASATCASLASRRFAKRHVLALAPGPEGLGERHAARAARREQRVLEEIEHRLVLPRSASPAFSAACASWSSFMAVSQAACAWRSLADSDFFLAGLWPGMEFLLGIRALARTGFFAAKPDPWLESRPSLLLGSCRSLPLLGTGALARRLASLEPPKKYIMRPRRRCCRAATMPAE